MAIWHWLARCWILLETGVPEPDETSQHGISECLTVLGFILSQAIAAIISQIGKPPLYKAAVRDIVGLGVIYSAVSIVILGVIVKMLRSTRIKAGWVRRTYDGGTITLMRYVFASGLVIVLLVPGLAIFGVLPAQEPPFEASITDYRAEVRSIKSGPEEVKGHPVVAVIIPVSPAIGRRELPADLTLWITLQHELLRTPWRAVEAELYEGDETKEANRHVPTVSFINHPGLRDPSAQPVPKFACRLHELIPNARYTFVLYLYKPKITKADAESMAATLNGHKEKTLDMKAEW